MITKVNNAYLLDREYYAAVVRLDPFQNAVPCWMDAIELLKSIRHSLPDSPACVLGDAILHLMDSSECTAAYWGMRHV